MNDKSSTKKPTFKEYFFGTLLVVSLFASMFVFTGWDKQWCREQGYIATVARTNVYCVTPEGKSFRPDTWWKWIPH